ncbi:kinase-like protein [Auricularia subglabra TFB-10046 SS5]|uniref:Kinase-like protein n=1 Tax=Auricularia subglabra (strain TFB-10046 / SS5) TaxID=717982 RepID=J0D8V9_AURST|nr:kinase-like protein [Auricularia subglabra TFB-10046 SS5]
MQTTVSYRGQLLTVIVSDPQNLCGHGATATVLYGTVLTASGIECLALKVFQPFLGPERMELLNREIAAWQKLRHERILPFIGRCTLGINQVALVTPFMKNGNMCEYLRTNPTSNRLELIVQVAEGLQYLHCVAGVVHGDIKGENILISDGGTILLADFGLSTLVEAADNVTATHIRRHNTVRFSAPELLTDSACVSSWMRPSGGQVQVLRSKTTFSDMFAFGMLIYQIYTGRLPWHGQHETSIMLSIIGGRSPPRPTDGEAGRRFCDVTWLICEQCWAAAPLSRPSITEALARLQSLKQAHANESSDTSACHTGALSLNPCAAEFLPRIPTAGMYPVEQAAVQSWQFTLNSNSTNHLVQSFSARAPRLDPHATPFVSRFSSTVSHNSLPVQGRPERHTAVCSPTHISCVAQPRSGSAVLPLKRGPPPPLTFDSLTSFASPFVDSPRTPDLILDAPSSVPSSPSTANPTPTRSNSELFNPDAKPFAPRFATATMVTRGSDAPEVML